MAQTQRILIVEDDDGIAAALVRALTAQGYDVDRAATGTRARAAVREAMPDLVLLDLGLPDSDGLDVCRSLTSDHAGLRVLVLTARVEEIDIVLGLDAGAIDYVTKPFRLAELLARIRAHLRVVSLAPGRDAEFAVGPLTLDPASRRVWLDGTEIGLRAKEFDLLAELMANAGSVVTREDLMSRVWDEQWFGSTKTLDVHVAHLRRKLGDRFGEIADSNAKASDIGFRITTLRGVGYRLDKTPTE